jgi:hypothetical protein
VLVDCDVGSDEILIENRLDFGGLDKPIEFLAPASPGSMKDNKYGPVIGLRLRLGLR